jgi:hypothetical protein
MSTEELVDRIMKLPPARREQVENFIDFLISQINSETKDRNGSEEMNNNFDKPS